MDLYTINKIVETCLAVVGLLINVPIVVYMIRNKNFKPLSVVLLNIFVNNIVFALTKIVFWYVIKSLHVKSLSYKITYLLFMKLIGQSCTWVVALCTLVIGCQRWVATCMPLRTMQVITKRNTICALVGVYVFSYALSGSFTALVLTGREPLFKKLQMIGLIVCLFIVVIYTHLLLNVLFLKKTTVRKDSRGKKHGTSRRTTGVCLTYTLIFLISYAPFLINDFFALGVTHYVIHLFWLDTFINPLIFITMDTGCKRGPQRGRSSRSTAKSTTSVRSIDLQKEHSTRV